MTHFGQPDEGDWDWAYEDFRTSTPRPGTLSYRALDEGMGTAPATQPSHTEHATMTTTTTSHDNGQSTIQITRYWENNAEIAHVVTVWERGYGSLRSSLYRGALESPTRRRGHSVFNTNQTSDAAVAMHQSTCDYADMVLA